MRRLKRKSNKQSKYPENNTRSKTTGGSGGTLTIA
jgi:hypothetical protein